MGWEQQIIRVSAVSRSDGECNGKICFKALLLEVEAYSCKTSHPAWLEDTPKDFLASAC